MEQENCKDVHRKQNSISILTIISAVRSGRPVEIGPGWAGEGERAAKVRAGGRHSHLRLIIIMNLAQQHNSDASCKDEMSCHLLSGHQGRAA